MGVEDPPDTPVADPIHGRAETARLTGCRLASGRVHVPHVGDNESRIRVVSNASPLRLVPDSGRTDPCQVGRPAGDERARQSERSAGVQGGQRRLVTPPLLPRDPRRSGPGQESEVARDLEESGTRAGNGLPRRSVRRRRVFPARGFAALACKSAVYRRVPPILRGIQL